MPRVKIDYVVSFSSESPEAPASNLLASEAGRGRWLCARGESSCSVLLQLPQAIQEAPASNLLASEAGRGRWLCARGESSCSVLLQLPQAIQISSITIGAHLAALVEVLVGRSETPSEPFQVLVASSVFLSPIDSRRATEGDSAADRVRTFNTEQLAADVRSKRWDRVRVVCSQPYNKHCKYGLSFIHIFSPESSTVEKSTKASESDLKDMSKSLAKPALKLPLDVSPQDSDDDEFKPGALFAKHRAAAQTQETSSQSQESSNNTDAQIRKATSQAIKNVFDSSTKIVRTPISKPKGAVTLNESKSDRTRENLMYDDEDAGPHDKIDRVVSAHKDQQAKDAEKANKEKEKHCKEKASKDKHPCDSSKQKKDRSKDENSLNRTSKEKHRDRNDDSGKSDDKIKTSHSSHKDKDRTESRSKSPQARKGDRSLSSKQERDDKDNKKQVSNKQKDIDKTLYAGPLSDRPHELLRGVVFVLSGYENPRRAAVRDAALAMGAAFQRDWGPACTHLICAFPNTPKLKTVRSSPNGDKAVVVTAEWIERQAARRRRLPWQWFATEPKLRVTRARAASGEDPPEVPGLQTRRDMDDSDSEQRLSNSADVEDYKKKNKDTPPQSECDTDDEIERVIRKNAQKRGRVTSEEESPRKKKKPDSDLANSSQGSDVAFVRDERIKAEITVGDSDSDATDKEDLIGDTQDLATIEELPSFFEGCTFAVYAVNKPMLDEKLLRRYVRTYGGEIVEAHEDDEDLEVDYVLCLSSNTEGIRHKGRKVRGDWVWRCHERQKLCSPGEFAL